MFAFFFGTNKKKVAIGDDVLVSAITDLNVQLFTSDELVKQLVEHEAFESFLNYFTKEFLIIRDKPSNLDLHRHRIQIHHLENIVSKPVLCQTLCQNMLFLDKLLQLFASINRIIDFDIEDYKSRAKIEDNLSYINLELVMIEILMKILKHSIPNMNSTHRNNFLNHTLCSLIKIMKEQENLTPYPSFHLPIQRAFSLILSMKMYYNKELFEMKNLEKFLLTLCFEDLKELERFLIDQFALISGFLIFLKEIGKNLWNSYCNLLDFYPKIHNKPFFDLDLFYFQILTHLLSEKNDIMLNFFLYKNKKMKEFLLDLTSKNDESIEFSKETIDFLEEIFNLLLIITSPLNLPLINCWSFLESDPELDQIKMNSIEKVLEGLLLQGNILSIKALKLKAYLFINETYELEKNLENIGYFDPKVKNFKLKNENPENIDPFYYIKDSTFLYESFENLAQKYKEKEPLCLDNCQPKNTISILSETSLHLISQNLIEIVLALLIKGKNISAYPIFLLKLLKLFSKILTHCNEKAQKQYFAALTSQKLRNSLQELQNTNSFMNIKLSIDKLFTIIDDIGFQTNQKLIKLPSTCEEQKSQSSYKKEQFLQKQKNIKEQFLMQQAKFLQNNQQFLEEEFKTSHHQVICVFCKEEIALNVAYGHCAYFNKSNIYKYALYQQILGMGLTEDDKDLLFFYGKMNFDSFYFKDLPDQYCFSSCFHYMHTKCYEDFMKSSKRQFSLEYFEYSCPLCNRLSNIFIPGTDFLLNPFEPKNIDIGKLDALKFIGKNYDKTKELKKNSKINDFFDDVMKVTCVLDGDCNDTVMSILENALVSVVEALPIVSFNQFLNKQLVIYKNLLYSYRNYLNEEYESETKADFVKKQKNLLDNFKILILNENCDVRLLEKNIDKMVIEYSLLNFIYYTWEIDELYQHLSYLFCFALIWKVIQYLFVRTYKNSEFLLTKVNFLDVLKEKEFIRIQLQSMKSFTSVMFMIFNFEDKVLFELNKKNFISDEEELTYLNSLIDIKKPLNIIFEAFYPRIEVFYKNCINYFHSILDKEKQFYYTFESFRLKNELYFKLYELNSNFSDLMSLFAMRKCDLCDNFSKFGELCLCLICGATICNRNCTQNINSIGNLNIHAKEKHCGCSIFINMQNKDIFFIASPKNFAEKCCLYNDRYGQTVKLKSADWGSFVLNNDELNRVKEIVVKNGVAQEIWYKNVKNNLFFKAGVF